jgi:hypothetical protein
MYGFCIVERDLHLQQEAILILHTVIQGFIFPFNGHKCVIGSILLIFRGSNILVARILH